MKSPIRPAIRILFCLLFAAAPPLALAQDIPDDLKVVATSGGLAPGAGHTVIRIGADGQGTYLRFDSSDIEASAARSSSFALSNAELEQLWQAIEANDFFNLQPEHANEEILDRTFAKLTIIADGNEHTVSTRNIAVDGFDAIMATINDLTPGDDDLNYDTTPPVNFTPLDICEMPFKSGGVALEKPVFAGAGPVKPGMKGTGYVEPGIKETGSLTPGNAGTAESVLATIRANAGASAQNGDAHPGTVVAHRLSLQEAVDRGIVTLSGKGGTVFGDGVSISINNQDNHTSDRLSLTMYIEFWGAEATPSVVAGIESAIESIWGGHMTSTGQTLDVDVVTRISQGATAPPGTAGYHQIEIVPAGSVDSHIDELTNINEGVGSGRWEDGDLTDELKQLYAHEAGHLMGLEDQYEAYAKQEDGTWERESDGETFTDSELADVFAPLKPELTLQEILDKINDGRERITHPLPGSEDDIMGSLEGTVQQSDIDHLAGQSGLIIEIRPGDILVNKEDQQNFAITRSEDVFVPPGGSKQLDGLYVACIDLSKSVPAAGVGFDVAPPLSQWAGIEAAEHLLALLEYVNEQEFFCPGSSSNSQLAVWRLSDDYAQFNSEQIDEFLLEAGVDVGARPLHFPRIPNSNADDPNTTVLVPRELYVPIVTSSTGFLTDVGDVNTVTGAVGAPSGAVETAEFSWSLQPPVGSAATLTGDAGETIGFTADVRGLYHVSMQADVTDYLENTFTLNTDARFAAADAFTETFESGTLGPGSAFKWETQEETPWTVTQVSTNTGEFAAESADIDNDGVTTLKATFDQATAGSISFAFSVSSEEISDVLEFSIDGNVVGSWSGDVEWSTFSFDLPAGTHAAAWTYRKDLSVSSGFDGAWIDDVFFPVGATFTAIEGADESTVPTRFLLSQNYPNPFNPTTTITYDIPQSEQVSLFVYDALGRRVAALVDRRLNAGRYEVQFDGSSLPNGVYHYELRAGAFADRKAMVLLK